ncbi:fatty acid desaturase [Paenimyroides tangerinum]|uniref:fatty acid desaturase n=1 Tax=Paenimyroides tangerinum TaxID=2488728 RepID=UPI001F39CB30|nr:fatty acid desaturase [Paenimyroides tangerinum]
MKISIQEIRKKTVWKDLNKLSMKGKIIENFLNIPWLIISWILAYKGYYFLAFLFSVIYFLTTLRQVHNGIHNSLGLNKKNTRLSLLINSIFMSVSASAIKFNHLRHHKYNLSEEDYEGITATMKWYQAILYGPVFMFNIHLNTIKKGNSIYRKQLFLETIFIIIFVFIAIYFKIHFLIYHIIVMMFFEGLMAFFAVWAVHHDTEENPEFPRTQRGAGWKSFISADMFFHLEHHLFPSIPTHNLKEVSKRLDDVFPDLDKKNVF